MDEPKRRRGRPATGETPKRYLRPGPIWDEAAELARLRQETTTAFVVRAIEREVARVRAEERKREHSAHGATPTRA